MTINVYIIFSCACIHIMTTAGVKDGIPSSTDSMVKALIMLVKKSVYKIVFLLSDKVGNWDLGDVLLIDNEAHIYVKILFLLYMTLRRSSSLFICDCLFI